MNNAIGKVKSLLMNEPLSLLRFVLTILATKTICRDIIYLSRTDFFDPSTVHKSWHLLFVPESLVSLVRDQPIISIITILCIGGAASIGLFGRLNLVLLSISAIIISGTRDGIGFFDHDIALSSQVILVLALVPNSLNISVDSILLPKLKMQRFIFSSDKSWGVQLILVLLAVTYFTAGFSKIRYGGLQWMDGKTLSFYFKNHVYRFEPGTKQLFIGEIQKIKNESTNQPNIQGFTYGNYRTTGVEFVQWIADKKGIMIFLSVFSIVFELCGFLLFTGSRNRNLFLTVAICFHTGIGLLMGLYFTHYRVIAFFLIDWKYAFGNLKNISLPFVRQTR